MSIVERVAAIDMGQNLVQRNFGHSLQKDGNTDFKDDGTIYRFLEDDEGRALNSTVHTQCEPRPGNEVLLLYV